MKKKWGLIIDVARCHDCNNCFLACKDEFVGNHWPPYSMSQPHTGHRWMNIHRREHGNYPLVAVAYLPVPCQHCQNPPCLKSAENDAIVIRQDGIVLIDPEKAAGQTQLADACPYNAIFWNEEANTPQKCTMCAHLLDEGWKEPRCAQVCPTGAITALKLSPEEWKAKIAKDKLSSFMPELGVKTRVVYKNLKEFTHGHIAGSVALKETDEVAENAQVRLTDKGGKSIAKTCTNNYGDFKFKALPEVDTRFFVEITVIGLPKKRLTVDYKKSLSLGTIMI